MGRLRLGLLALTLIATPLAGCETSLFFGYGLPNNDACRSAASQPSKPVSVDCLDSLGD